MKVHLRRKDKEIVEEAILKEILKTSKYITVAFSKEDQPYLVSLSHGYDESRNCIYFHCAKEGKKLDYLKANSNVWGQALVDHGYQEGECNHYYTTVHFKGRALILNNIEEKRKAMECMIRQLNKKPDQLIAKLETETLQNTVLGRIDIEDMTGKKNLGIGAQPT